MLVYTGPNCPLDSTGIFFILLGQLIPHLIGTDCAVQKEQLQSGFFKSKAISVTLITLNADRKSLEMMTHGCALLIFTLKCTEK